MIVLNMDIVFSILSTIHKRENKDYLPCITDEKTEIKRELELKFYCRPSDSRLLSADNINPI